MKVKRLSRLRTQRNSSSLSAFHAFHAFNAILLALMHSLSYNMCCRYSAHNRSETRATVDPYSRYSDADYQFSHSGYRYFLCWTLKSRKKWTEKVHWFHFWTEAGVHCDHWGACDQTNWRLCAKPVFRPIKWTNKSKTICNRFDSFNSINFSDKPIVQCFEVKNR